MGLIGEPVALLDIASVEPFVQRTIDRSGISYGPSEREELLAEGITLLYELAGKYEPGRGGRDPAKSRFSGYAAWALPKRLGDAWHRNHPEHHYITDPQTGKRGWTYEKPMLSLDALTAGGDRNDSDAGERHLLHSRTINAFTHVATLSLSRLAPPPAA